MKRYVEVTTRVAIDTETEAGFDGAIKDLEGAVHLDCFSVGISGSYSYKSEGLSRVSPGPLKSKKKAAQ